MNDETGIIDVKGYSLQELKSVSNERLQGALSRLADTAEAPSAGFQSSF